MEVSACSEFEMETVEISAARDDVTDCPEGEEVTTYPQIFTPISTFSDSAACSFEPVLGCSGEGTSGASYCADLNFGERVRFEEPWMESWPETKAECEAEVTTMFKGVWAINTLPIPVDATADTTSSPPTETWTVTLPSGFVIGDVSASSVFSQSPPLGCPHCPKGGLMGDILVVSPTTLTIVTAAGAAETNFDLHDLIVDTPGVP